MGGQEQKAVAEEVNELSEQVIAAAIDVHKELGPGLLERTYEEALAVSLEGVA